MAELIVLKEARILVKIVYDIVSRLPEKERYNLYSQMTRAATSVCLNIREGSAFHNKNREVHLLRAIGSLYEVDECFLLIKSVFDIDMDEDNFRNQYKKTLHLINRFLNPSTP